MFFRILDHSEILCVLDYGVIVGFFKLLYDLVFFYLFCRYVFLLQYCVILCCLYCCKFKYVLSPCVVVRFC